MNLFSEFDASAWQDQGVQDKITVLVAPNGHPVKAVLTTMPIPETWTDADGHRHDHTLDVPVWSLGSGIAYLGHVYRRSARPLDDIRHALDLGAERRRILNRIEIWALTGGVGAGTWRLHAGTHHMVCSASSRKIPIPWGPSPLGALVQSAHIQLTSSIARLTLGHRDALITVPISRHAAMERLRQLCTGDALEPL